VGNARHKLSFPKAALLGPRALAILSCALALLAAQPAFAAPAAPAPRVATFNIPQLPNAAVAAAAPSRRQTASRATRAQGDLLSSARRLHILATMEILHRLLAVELQPPLLHHAPAFLCPPALLATIEFQPALQPRRSGHAPPLPLSQERHFVLTHALLAPPVA
jgi:hypothetical protein